MSRREAFPRMPRMLRDAYTIDEAFDAKVSPEPNSGCHLWVGALKNGGYPAFNAGRTVRAHRYAFERERGPVPAGLVLDHLCRVRCCVNPRHLEAVTQRENLRRGRVARGGN